jgi:hypothetical protein
VCAWWRRATGRRCFGSRGRVARRRKSFCSGLDIASFMSGRGGTGVLLDRDGDPLANFAQRVAYDWSLVPAPVIAAMHENCFGGGLQIALGADFGHHCQAEEVAAAARGSVGWPRTPRAGRAGRNVDSLLAGRVGATKRAIARWIFYAQMMDDSATFDSDNLVDFLKLTAATVDRAGDQLSGIRPTSSPPRAWRARARRRARISARRRRPANGRPARCRCPPGHARRSDRPRAR